MKVIFFDTKDYEAEYFKKSIFNNLNCIYLKESLNSNKNYDDIKDLDILCCSINSRCTSDILSKIKNLKSIMTRSTGFDHIDLKYCKQNNIRVYNVPHYGDWTVAEYTFALILSASRNIIPSSEDLKLSKVDLSKYMGLELHSKTIGIIGLGQIGERVAQIAQGFNMKILYFDIKDVKDYKKVSLEVLLKSSDFITINCPLNKDTEHLLSYKEFRIMKDGAVIVNTARGEIIDTKALVDAIKSNKISYAGLDVLECEFETTNYNHNSFCTSCVKNNCLKKYMLNQKLMKYKNVIITPHIAYNTKEATNRIMDITAKNIKFFAKNDFGKIENSRII